MYDPFNCSPIIIILMFPFIFVADNCDSYILFSFEARISFEEERP